MGGRMGLFGYLKNITVAVKDTSRQIKAIDVLLKPCFSLSDSRKIAARHNIHEDMFLRFHVHKRCLAVNTVRITAAIVMESGAGPFLELFQVELDRKEELSEYSFGAREYVEIDRLYVSASMDIASGPGYASANGPVTAAMLDDKFAEVFATILSGSTGRNYIEAGRDISRTYSLLVEELLWGL